MDCQPGSAAGDRASSNQETPLIDEPRPVLGPLGADVANQCPKQDYGDWRKQARRGRAGLLHSLAAWHPIYKCQTISTISVLPRRRVTKPESRAGWYRDGAPYDPYDRRPLAHSRGLGRAIARGGHAHRSTIAGASQGRPLEAATARSL